MSEKNNYNLINLDGYKLYKKNVETKLSKHGGLLTYIKNTIKVKSFEILKNNKSFEGLLSHLVFDDNKHISILNVYRPPRNNNVNFEEFFSEYIPKVVNILDSQKELIITGDFNINLLNNNNNTLEYFDHMTDLQLLPFITFPSRFESNSASLIDHIFCKFSLNAQTSNAGILLSNISDHCPVFLSFNISTCLNPHQPKYTKISGFTKDSEISFINDVKKISFDSIINDDPNCDPNINFNILHDILQDIRINNCPEKTVKFKKHKHKLTDWITTGILNSIRIRDKLYKKIKKLSWNNPSRLVLNNYLKQYNIILKSAINQTKCVYYENIFNKFNNNIKKTWETIRSIITNKANKNILPNFIKDENNICVTDQKK